MAVEFTCPTFRAIGIKHVEGKGHHCRTAGEAASSGKLDFHWSRGWQTTAHRPDLAYRLFLDGL